MFFVNILYSIFIPVTIWLLYGAPDMSLNGNLAFFIVVMLHLYAVIWSDTIFKLVDGDRFTYSMVSKGINLMSFTTSFVVGFFTFYYHDWEIKFVTTIHPMAWGLVCVGFLITVAVPLLTTRHVDTLPTINDRRTFVDPTDEGRDSK